MKKIRKWLKSASTYVLVEAVVLLFAIIYAIFFLQIWKDTALANAYVAIGTLALALVTTISIGVTLWLENQRKKDVRKEQVLKEIIEWALSAIELGIREIRKTTQLETSGLGAAFIRGETRSEPDMKSNLSIIQIQGIYIRALTVKQFTEKSDIVKHIDNVLTNIQYYKDYLNKTSFRNDELKTPIKADSRKLIEASVSLL